MATGSKFYYDKGYVRIGVRLNRVGLFKLKSQAIEKECSVLSIIGDAIGFMMANADDIPSTFPTPDGSHIIYTFINKDDHKKLKMISALVDRPMCDVAGFIIEFWNKYYEANKSKKLH